MTLSETQLREQIKRAVAEARRRAYERASMEGGARTSSKEEQLREQIKSAVAEARRRAAERASMEGGKGRAHLSSNTALKRFVGAKANPKLLTRLEGRRNVSSGRVGAWDKSPLQADPRNRSYAVYVKVPETNEFKLVCRAGKAGKVVKRKFHGRPVAAARRFVGALVKNRQDRYGLGLGADASELLAEAKALVERGESVQIMLVETTQGVRKGKLTKSGKLVPTRSGSDPLSKYFKYYYFVSRERQTDPAKQSHVVQGKQIQTPYVNVAVRTNGVQTLKVAEGKRNAKASKARTLAKKAQSKGTGIFSRNETDRVRRYPSDLYKATFQ